MNPLEKSYEAGIGEAVVTSIEDLGGDGGRLEGFWLREAANR